MFFKSPSKYFIFLIIVMTTALLINAKSLNYFLFQDDFFNFNITRVNSVSEFATFFNFRSDIIAYRPISLLTYFFILSNLFGFNSFGFRIISFGILFGCGLLIFRFTQKVSKNNDIALLTTALWILSSIHFTSLSQINYNLIGTFFFLTTSLLFLNSLEGKRKYYTFSLLSFLITVGSFEFAVTWPLIFGFYYFFVLRNNLQKTIKIFWPFIVLSISYLILRSIYVNPPPTYEYQIAFSKDSLKALVWYLIWSFNIPEDFKKQAYSKIILLNDTFIWQYWALIVKTLVGASWIFFLGIVLPLFRILKNGLKINKKLIFFSLAWFFIGISPVLLLPNHNFIMYLEFPSIGIYFLIAYLVVKSNLNFLKVQIITIWLLLTITTLGFYRQNSYIVESQKFAKSFYERMKVAYSNIPPGSIIYYPLDDIEKRQALMDQEAIKAILETPTVSIYYNRKSLEKDYKSGQIKGFVYLYQQQ